MGKYTHFLLVLMLSACQGAMAQTLYLGLNADLRGGSAQSGRAIQMGAEFAIEEINQSGMLGKTKLALIAEDHRGNPARGADNVLDFAGNQDVIAILGGLHTPVIMHELPLIHRKKIPYLVPWAAGTPIIRNGYEPNYVFRLSVRDEYAGEVLVRHAKSSGFKKVGLLLERTGWGRSNDKSMHKATDKLGLNITGVSWFNWGEQAFASVIDQLEANGAEAIMFVGNAPEGAHLVKAMASRPANQRLPIISHWGITGGNFVEIAGVDTLNQVDLRVLQTYLFQDIAANQTAQTVLAKYKKRNQQNHDFVDSAPGLVHTYDLVHILAKAIKHAPSLTRDDIRSQLEKIKQHKGLIKTYQRPFTKTDHEALDASDYQIARYNKQGYIVPWSN